MNDEKRLDESTLEKVSGGGGGTTHYRFKENNCFSCRHNNTPNCYYGSSITAFETLGSNPRAKCPYKEA